MGITRWLRNHWDRSGAVLALLLGLVALGLGWQGVSEGRLTTQQLPYLASGGLLGVFALGIAGTLWLSADLRDEWRKLDDIERAIRDAGALPLDSPAPSAGADRRSEAAVSEVEELELAAAAPRNGGRLRAGGSRREAG